MVTVRTLRSLARKLRQAHSLEEPTKKIIRDRKPKRKSGSCVATPGQKGILWAVPDENESGRGVEAASKRRKKAAAADPLR